MLALLCLLTAYAAASVRIGADVRAITTKAMQLHHEDPVEALLAFVEDPDQSLPERDRAVWALGQLGDSRALPVLREYHTGKPCDHANTLCQREIEKAINLASGGVNVTALVWRRDFFCNENYPTSNNGRL